MPLRGLLFLLVLSAFIASTSSLSAIRKALLHHRLSQDAPPSSSLVDYQWATQKVDHFSPQNQAVWKQKYIVNTAYWGGNGYPIFMLLGGEGPIRNDSVSSHFILAEYAQIYQALIVSAEHRFYGDSIPTADLSTDNLKYLSSEQALADFAVLATLIKENYNAPDSKLISFGGSYSGSLSAWFRLKYPHIVHAALASSAPVQAQTNFPEYFQVVQNSLSSLNGCDSTIKQATDYYTNLVTTPAGKSKIVSAFNTCSTLDSELDIVTFFEFLADTISGFVQYNNDNNAYYPFNIDKMCQILTGGSIDEAFPAFISQWNQFSGSSCSDSSYQQDLETLMSVDPKSPAAAGRSWYYQTCTEFGYYQTGFSGSIFSDQITLDYFIGMCQAAFGITIDQVQSNVNWTNTFYGARSVASSRILFTNGLVDPWHALGITSEINAELPAVLIEGTAHCADLYPSRPLDLPQLTAARKIFLAYLSNWLTEPLSF